MNKITQIFNNLPLMVRKLLTPMLWIIGILISLPILYLGIITISYIIWTCWELSTRQPFSAALWDKAFIGANGQKSYSLNGAFARCYMYKDLVKNQLRLHMTYGEVIKLLGDPDGGYVTYYVNPELKSLRYALGKRALGKKLLNFLAKDTGIISSLYLYFNRDQKLVAVKMHSKNGYEEYPLLDNTIAIQEIQNKYPNGSVSKEFLFECEIKPTYQEQIKCMHYFEAPSPYVDKSIINYEPEYCNIDEVKKKWGHEVW